MHRTTMTLDFMTLEILPNMYQSDECEVNSGNTVLALQSFTRNFCVLLEVEPGLAKMSLNSTLPERLIPSRTFIFYFLQCVLLGVEFKSAL